MQVNVSMAGRVAVCLVALVVASSAAAAPPTREPASHPVLKAYAQARQYRAQVDHRQEQAADDGRRGAVERSDYQVALDRETNRFMLDTPDFRLVQDGATLRVLAHHIPGRYLEVQVDPQPNLAVLSQQAPMMFDRPLVDVALLLSDDPIAALSGGASAAPVTVAGAGSADPATYQVTLREGTMTWQAGADDDLVHHAGLNIDARFLEPGTSMQFVWDYNVTHHDRALPPDTFAFDTTGRTAVATVQELLAPGGGGGGASPVEHEAADFTLPLLRGGDFHLNDDAADVVVLHFWTTWIPGSQDQLSTLQQLHDWATRDQPDRVQVFLVGFGESAESLAPLSQNADLTLPVLIDEQMTLAGSYGIATVPRTLIIADGNVRKGYSGVAHDFVDVVRKDVETLLQEQRAAEPSDEPAAEPQEITP